MKKIVLIILLFLACNCFAQQTEKEITLESIQKDVEKVECKNSERIASVEKLFKEKGATDEDLKIEDFKDGKNLVVSKKGKTDETVIISAHYDSVSDGCGAIDNWTGVVIIANLFQTLKKYQTNKTLKFVAFDKEEKGLIGSKAMAKSIDKEDRKNYCAVVNLDGFGFGYPQALSNISDETLIKLAKDIAKTFDFEFHTASIMASSDSQSFREKKIPAITLHGMGNDWQKYLHTSNDAIKNVNSASVFAGYNFSLRMIAEIDASGCQDFR